MTTPVEAALRGLALGEPAVFKNLAVFPLVAGAEVAAGYLTLAEALKGGHARVTEVSAGGVVPELLFDNSSPHGVLLLDGDELVGAKQNRVLNVTVLVGANQKVVIPVSCVERGRWHALSTEFRSEDRMMFARGRASKMSQVSRSLRERGTRHSDQGAVWDEVGAKAARLQASAPTGAMSDVYAHVGSDTRDFRAAFRAEQRQVGGVFAIGGRPAGLELFDAPGTLRSTLGRLVESYALDAIELGGRPRRADLEEAKDFLSRAASARTEVARAVGLGEELRLEAPGLVGEALVVDGRVVHLSVLEAPAGGARTASASERARRAARRGRAA